MINISERKASLDNNYCLILTSNSVEKAAVKSVTTNAQEAFIGQGNSGAYLGLIGDSLVLHLSGESGTSRDQSIGRIATTFLRSQSMPRPRLVLLVGFCWRNPETTPDNVLIVSSQVHCVNVLHATKGAFQPQEIVRGSPLSIDELKAARLLECLHSVSGSVRVGPIASAETLYKEDQLRSQLVATHPAILGGEMEAFAFLDSSFLWLVLKAGSDAGGVDFDRNRQAEAAARAAGAIRPLIAELEAGGTIGKEESLKNASVRDLIEGDVIEFDARRYRTEQLNEVLEMRIGPNIEYKLRRYLAPSGYDPQFLRHSVNALLELAQNAVKHGGANSVQFEFANACIHMQDDGDAFDPRLLTAGGRGGARAFRTLMEYHSSEQIIFKFVPGEQGRGNTYSFELPQVDASLDHARRVCQIRILDDVIGMAHGRPVLFNFDSSCTMLYLDTTPIRMSSRKYTLAGEVKRLVDEGKQIYVGCASEEDVNLFKEELRDCVGSGVTVFIDTQLFGPNSRQ
ncbi:hypothetical protein ACO0LO_19735 [Undibacterium sp. TJN25]|uniref:hypothetical protein n=1 Tax=Undibacterium sp. TJN25 TaxID=3413056 RepID=UPI003BF258C4